MSDDSVLSSLTGEQRVQYESLSVKQRAAFLRKAAELADAPDQPKRARGYTQRTVTAFGETKNLTEWAADPRCRVGRPALYQRIFILEWPAEQAIVTPLQPHVLPHRKIEASSGLPQDRGGA